MGNLDSSIKQGKRLFLWGYMIMFGLSVRGYIGSKKMRNMDLSTNKVFLPIHHLNFSQL